GSLVLSGSGGYSNLGASLLVTLGKLVVNTTGLLEIGTGNNSITNSGGTIEFTAGTVNIFGRLTLTAGTTTINGAVISVDGQKANSLGATSNAFEISGTANVTFSSGSLTIVDPLAAPTTGRALKVGSTTGTVDLSGSTFIFGDGISTTTGTAGFQISNNTASLIPFGHIILNTGGIAGRNVSMTTSLIIGGTLTLNTGTFTVGANTLTLSNPIAGTLTNFIADNTSSITIAGTASGINIPAGVTALNGLTVNNSNGTTLQGPLSLTGILTLTNGRLTLGSSDLTLGTASTIGGTPSAASMVVATGTGQFRKGFAAAGSFVFPVGDNTVTPQYSPVTLNFATGTFGTGNYAGVNLVKAKYPGDPNTVSYLTRYWNLMQSGITDFNCNAMFQYLPTDVNGTESQIYCIKVNPLPFVAYNPANTTNQQLTANGLTAFGSFTGTQMQPAPATFNVTGTGSYCEGGTGLTVTLSGSEINASYQLKKGGVDEGPAVPGTGSALTWPDQLAGTYTVNATSIYGTTNMNGNAIVTANPLPVPTISGSVTPCISSTENVYTTEPGMTGYLWTVSSGGTITSSLFNNGPVANSSGTGAGGADESVIISPIATPGTVMNLNSATTLADDFTVSGPDWNVSSIDVFGYQTGSSTTSTFTGLYIRIWNGQPGVSGSSVVWGDLTTNRVSGSSFSNIYRVTTPGGTQTNRPVMKITAATSGLILPAGNYWIEWTTTGSLPNSPYSPPVTITGQPQTGNAISGTSGVYSPISYNTATQGMPFIMHGFQNTVTVTWNTAGPQTVSVSYTDGNGCTAASATVKNVTVEVIPTAAGMVSGPTSVTQGQTDVNYSIPVIPNATGYVWTLPQGATITSGDNTESILVSFSPTAISGIMSVYGTNLCGNGTPSDDLAIIVNPFLFEVTGTGTYCPGGAGLTVTLSGSQTGTEYQLKKDNINEGPAVPGTGLALTWPDQLAGTYTVEATSIYGSSLMNGSAVISEYPSPVPTISGDFAPCISSTDIAYTTEPGMTDYFWAVSSGGMITSSRFNNGPIVNSTGTGAGGADESVIVSPITTSGSVMNFNSATTLSDDFTVSGPDWNVSSIDVFGYQTGSSTVSTFTGVYVRIWNGQPGVAGSSVIWGDLTTNRISGSSFTNAYRVSTPGGSQTNRPVMKITAATSGLILPAGDYWIEWTTTGSLPGSPFSSPVTISGQPQTGNAISGASGVYSPILYNTNSQGMPFVINISGFHNTITVTWNTAGPQTVSVNYTDENGCTAASATVENVNVEVIPTAAGTVSGPGTVTQGQTDVNYSIPVIPNATGYVWALPQGAAITSGDNTENIMVSFSADAVSGIMSVYGTNLCGNGTPSPEFNVTVNPSIPENLTVAGTVTGSEVKCYNATLTITVAGNNTTFLVETGGDATLIAGQNIIFLPGTTVQPGGHLLAYITTTSDYCGVVKAPSMVNSETKQLEVISDEQKPVFRAFPNPTDGKFILELNGIDDAVQTYIEVYRMTGELVSKVTLTGETRHQFNLEGQPTGIYILRIMNKENAGTVKIMKQ
ncbi:MAG: T9SS type A sorting domain-containing protein, partial [Bacteroidota bacterium]